MSSPERKRQILLARMQQAKDEATLSYARRLKVGAALITPDDRVIMLGRNGMPAGGDNNCEIVTKRTLEGGFVEKELETKPEVLHAENNVIAYCAKEGIATNGCTLVTTHSPCFECSKLIINSGIKRVVYETEYRLTEGIDLLKRYNVTTEKI
jgi:dCMP deaminase